MIIGKQLGNKKLVSIVSCHDIVGKLLENILQQCPSNFMTEVQTRCILREGDIFYGYVDIIFVVIITFHSAVIL